MSGGRSRRPSPGFVAVALIYSMIIAFFAWGLVTPDLDRVWWIHHALKTGHIKRLGGGDRRVLARTMARHTSLARALLDSREIGLISEHQEGWIASSTATIIRTSRSAHVRSLLLDVQTPRDLLPLSIVVRGGTWNRVSKVSTQGPLTIDLPAPPGAPEIIELQVQGLKQSADPSEVGLRVTFGGQP